MLKYINAIITTGSSPWCYIIKTQRGREKPPKKKPKNKGYCYVVNDEYVNPELRKIMIPVKEAIPGVLSINGYDFKCDIKTKTYKLEK